MASALRLRATCAVVVNILAATVGPATATAAIAASTAIPTIAPTATAAATIASGPSDTVTNGVFSVTMSNATQAATPAGKFALQEGVALPLKVALSQVEILSVTPNSADVLTGVASPNVVAVAYRVTSPAGSANTITPYKFFMASASMLFTIGQAMADNSIVTKVSSVSMQAVPVPVTTTSPATTASPTVTTTTTTTTDMTVDGKSSGGGTSHSIVFAGLVLVGIGAAMIVCGICFCVFGVGKKRSFHADESDEEHECE